MKKLILFLAIASAALSQTTGPVQHIPDGGDCRMQRTSTTVIKMAACGCSLPGYPVAAIAAAATSAAPTSTGTMRAYLLDDCTRMLGFSGAATVTVTGWTNATSITGFPEGSRPLYTFPWGSTTGEWDTAGIIDHRAAQQMTTILPGNGLSASIVNGKKTLTAELPIATAQAGTPWKVADTSSSTTVYTGCPASTITTYSDAMFILFRPTTTNTGSSNITLCAIAGGAKTIQKLVSGTLTNLASGDMDSDSWHLLIYNGTVYVKSPLEGGSSSSTPQTIFLPFGGTSNADTGYGTSWHAQGSTGLAYPTHTSQSAPTGASFANPSADSSEMWAWVILPPSYVSGAVQFKLWAYPNGVAGAVGQVAKMKVKTNCLIVGTDTRSTAFETPQDVNITITTSNGRGDLQTGSQSNLTLDSCTGGGMLKISLYRADSGDNFVDDLFIFSAALIF